MVRAMSPSSPPMVMPRLVACRNAFLGVATTEIEAIARERAAPR